jgi:ATP-dependent Lhr-like helicase
MDDRTSPSPLLPERFAGWFEAQGWSPREHQLEILAHARRGESVLLIAPTGGGKTLAGFLPSLVELSEAGRTARLGIHTIYISPLKALAVDIARNLERPVWEMGLDVSVETRTGDTPQHKRRRQRSAPPDILITTPEQLALLIADQHAAHLFRGLRTIVLDELHALVASKRGSLLSLGLARLSRIAPAARRIGLSATVARPDALRSWLVPQPEGGSAMAALVSGRLGALPEVSILKSVERVPWSGHSARYAIGEIYQSIEMARLALIFVNTRSQAEAVFQELWRVNDSTLPIALHHGSLDVAQRRKVEAAMAAGKLRAVVCTSTLDLGIDWGDVDLVVHVGAPKGSSRLIQRIGRSNHRLDEPSRAMLVPSNRFEVLECEAARIAVMNRIQDSERMTMAKLDVLAQHVLGTAVAGPFHPDDLYAEVRSAFAYAGLPRDEFDAVVGFVANGGYALKSYERYAKLRPTPEGRLRLAHPRMAQAYRLNVGTIIEDEMLKVRLMRSRRGAGKAAGVHAGRLLGEIEEGFINGLSIGDTFVFAGEVVRLESVEDLTAFVTRASSEEPAIPSYEGGKFPLSTFLAATVREMLADPAKQKALPEQVREWLALQRYASSLPRAGEMLVETFPRAKKHYLVCYPFDGRLAHQTLGMLLTRRLERWGAQPLGFVATDYALGIWMVRDIDLMISSGRLSLAALFDEDMLGDDLDAWLAESMLMKRTFRSCAIIAGLIERRSTAREKSGRQLTVSSDLIFDVLRTHQPDHVLLKAAWDDAADGLIDAKRLAGLLLRIRGHILHRALDRISPLSVPLMLEIGREPVYGESNDSLLEEAARLLIEEATPPDAPAPKADAGRR